MERLNWKSAVYSGGLYICGLASKVLNSYVFSAGKQDLTINEVLFYGGEDEKYTKQIGINNLFCIYYMIMHASKCIHICVPSLVSNTLANILLKAKQKNCIKIRVVVHSSEELQNLQKFAEQGIEVKVIHSSVTLEHEFSLIDAGEHDAVAVLGSIDYETVRVNCNRDATLLTSERAVVKTLNIEFERVWKSDANKF